LAFQNAGSVNWEIIVVDNASTDNTGLFAAETWQGFNKAGTALKVIREEKQGLSYARLRGVEEASFDCIIFCDDDNWLNDDYILTAYKILEADKKTGAVSGQCVAVAEVSLPNWFKQHELAYAVGTQAKHSCCMNAQGYIWGAGLVTRKSVFQNAVNEKLPSILSDRKGSGLSAGGDVEYCLRILLQGYNLYYSTDLKFQHFIPADRLTEQYKNALLKGFDEAKPVTSEYIQAANLKRLSKFHKIRLLTVVIKDFVKSFLKGRKAQPASYKLLFYFFDIGFKKREDLKIIKEFYNA
jgi:glycosyltransferase involved in cell wall biosynthesis